MKKGIFAGTICTAVLLLAACDKEDKSVQVNSTDTSFVAMTSISNNAEIQAGQLAATKGNTAMVKAFGQLMVNEHTPALQDLHTRASDAGLTIADTVDAEHRALMTRLNGLSGYSFDTAYMNSQIKDHAKTIDLFNAEISSGNHVYIRMYAQDYLPHIQMHYNKADSIRRLL